MEPGKDIGIGCCEDGTYKVVDICHEMITWEGSAEVTITWPEVEVTDLIP